MGKSFIGIPTTKTITNMFGEYGEDFTNLARTSSETYVYTSSSDSGLLHTGSKALWIYVKSDYSSSECTYILRNSSGQISYPLDSTHKYYFSAWICSYGTVGSFDFYWPIAEPAIISGATVSAARTWTRVSAVVSRSGFTNGNYVARVDYNGPTSGQSLFVDTMMLVDLSAAFGVGKEPTKEWCDANLPYATGSATVTFDAAHKITKTYIGIPKDVTNTIIAIDSDASAPYNFRSGTGTNNSWNDSFGKDCTYSISMYDTTGTLTEMTRLVGRYNLPFNNTHKYYFRCWLYQYNPTGSFDMYWPVSEPPIISGATVSNANTWERKSAVFTRTGFTNGSYLPRFDYNNPGIDGLHRLWISGMVLVDLTEWYGAGHEPDCAWCDTNIPYSTTAVTDPTYVARKIKKIYIGDANGKAKLCFTA